MNMVRKIFRTSHSPRHSVDRNTDRALARAYRDAPTQATRQELTVLGGLGR
jgi:hypothetical protein